MSVKRSIATDLDLRKNRLINVCLEMLPKGSQINLTPGQIYIDEDTNRLMVVDDSGSSISTGIEYTGEESISVIDGKVSLSIDKEDKVLSQSLNGLKSTLKLKVEGSKIYLLGQGDEEVSSDVLPSNSGSLYETTISKDSVEPSTISSDTHGCGVSPNVKTYLKVDESSSLIEVAVKVSISLTGDVTVGWNGMLPDDLLVRITN